MLDVSGCSSITDAGITAICNECTSLQSINLWYCSDITDVSIIALAKCGRLECVKLGECTNVTSDGIDALTNGHGGTLKTLDLSQCTALTPSISIDHISKRCEKLQVLSLREIEVNDNDVYTLSYYCSFLTHLDLSNCKNITDASLQYLACMRSLRQLDLYNNGLFTDEGFDHLRMRPFLRVQLSECYEA